jgi:hypothetical protein
MRKTVVHDEDEAPMWVTGGGLPDGKVVETDVMPFVEMIVTDNVWRSTFGHVGRMGGPNLELVSVAILVGKVELNEPVPVDVNVDAFADVDGVAKPCVAAYDEGKRVGGHVDFGTRVHKAMCGGRKRHQGTARRG